MPRLTEEEIHTLCKGVPNWHYHDHSISRDWIFADFNEALKFINRIGEMAEQHNHHPEILNVYNKVRLRFYTHTINGLTMKDFKIAKAIDSLT